MVKTTCKVNRFWTCKSDVDFERRARDVFVSPSDNYNVVSSFFHDVVNLVVVTAKVFDVDFLARSLGSIDTDVQYIVT